MRCHVVPMVYMKYWCVDMKVKKEKRKAYIFSKGNTHKDGELRNIFGLNGEIAETDLYIVDGKNPKLFEHYLDDNFENDWTNHVNRLSCEVSTGSNTISESEFWIESVATQIFRMKAYLHKSLDEAIDIVYDNLIPKEFHYRTKEEIKKERCNEYYTRAGLGKSDQIELLYDQLTNMGKMILVAPLDVEFITSDKPVTHILDENGNDGTWIFPITSRFCFVAENGKVEAGKDIYVKHISVENVKLINTYSIEWANEVVISSKKNIADLFHKIK